MQIRDVVRSHVSVALAAMVVLSGCGEDTGPSGPTDYTIRFTARVNGTAFACGQSYDNVGTTQSTITASDFRFYVHNVRLVRGNGTEVPLQLTQDQKWQLDDVALLDFENKTGSCANGTTEVNTQVVGTAEAGDYTGVKFVLGVPASRNHIDQATAPAPFSLSEMFWSWNAGYKYARIDLQTTGFPNGFFIHLGATGCNGASAGTPATECTDRNLTEVSLSGFDPDASQIVADLGSLLSQNNVDANQGGPAGCMSGNTDLDCSTIFAAWGLPFAGGSVPTSQRFFTVAPR